MERFTSVEVYQLLTLVRRALESAREFREDVEGASVKIVEHAEKRVLFLEQLRMKVADWYKNMPT